MKMKKYVAAGAAAVMAGSFAAFAATFDLNPTVLAVGEADVRACDLEVVSWGLDDKDGKVYHVGVATDDCTADEVAFAVLYDDAGNIIGRSGETRVNPTADRFNLRFSGGVSVEAVEDIALYVHTKTVG